MTINQLIPGYLGARTKLSDHNAFVALCWAVQDHRPDLDEDEVIKRVRTWQGDNWRENAADILAGPKGMTDEEADEIERVIQRRTTRFTPQREVSRAGFTLVELLVVVSILLVLTAIVVVSYNSSVNSERVRGSARQIQSVILGATSRSASRKTTSGLRLLLDQNDKSVATGFVYVGATKDYVQGSVTIERIDLDNAMNTGSPDGIADITPDSSMPYWWVVVRGGNLGRLVSQGLLYDGARIRLPANGNWYTIQLDPNPDLGENELYRFANDANDPREIVRLLGNYKLPPIYASPDAKAHEPTSYVLELQPALLPDEKPITFASGMVIDLYNSHIPASWYNETSVVGGFVIPPQMQNDGWVDEGRDPNNAAMKIIRQYSPRMDIMFGPNGNVVGATQAFGKIHLLLADVRDTTLNLPPESGQHDCTIISLFTRTGTVIVSPVDKIRSMGDDGKPGVKNVDDDGNGVTDFDENGIADPLEVNYPGSDDVVSERFYFSETGSVAGK